MKIVKALKRIVGMIGIPVIMPVTLGEFVFTGDMKSIDWWMDYWMEDL